MSEQNKALMRRFYDEVFNSGNTALIDELVAPDFVEHEEFPGLPNDRDGLKQWLTMMRSAFPDVRMVVDDLVAEGDRIVARLTMSGTQKEEFAGIPSSGKSFRVSTIDIVRIANGKAVEHWGVTDVAGMMQQLGAMPGS